MAGEVLHVDFMRLMVVTYSSTILQAFSFLGSMRRRHISPSDYPGLKFLALTMVFMLRLSKLIYNKICNIYNNGLILVLSTAAKGTNKKKSLLSKKQKPNSLLQKAFVVSLFWITMWCGLILFLLTLETKPIKLQWLEAYILQDPSTSQLNCKVDGQEITEAAFHYPLCDLKLNHVLPNLNNNDDHHALLPTSMLDLALLAYVTYSETWIPVSPLSFEYKQYNWTAARPEYATTTTTTPKLETSNIDLTGNTMHFESDELDTSIVAFRGTATPLDAVTDINMVRYKRHIFCSILTLFVDDPPN